MQIVNLQIPMHGHEHDSKLFRRVAKEASDMRSDKRSSSNGIYLCETSKAADKAHPSAPNLPHNLPPRRITGICCAPFERPRRGDPPVTVGSPDGGTGEDTS